MKLIVGLGNPGNEYLNTRHNLGFMAVDYFHADNFSPWKLAHGAYTARGEFNGEKCMLVKPQSYMNLSGKPVQELAAWYKVEPKDIIVLHDELDVPLGEVRVKIGGSAAGHNGIKDIVEKLGTPEFWRIRIGMKTERAETVPAEAFVLEKFGSGEMDLVRTGIDKALTELAKLVPVK
jgi:PTH1 family peptidyl-tRNA hydrolase